MNIINAKLSPIPMDKKLIIRSKLLYEMSRDKSKNVIFINAPAGYGKTTLLSQFGQGTDEKVIWYHLDQFDNELVTFISYFIENVTRCLKEQRNVPISNDGFIKDDIKAHVADLLNYLLLNSKDNICIIIDDFHYITKESINEWLSIFIKYMPSNIRLIISSRTKPNINIDFLLTSNRLLEIDLEQLRFSEEEEKEFIDNTNFEYQEIYNEDIIKKNNGWAFGLNLLKYVVNENIKDDYEILELYDKCFDNIFENFDDKEFLLSSCLLEILDSKACDYITNRTNSYETLKKMSHTGLFISRTCSGEFKYHDLFRDYLIKKVMNKKDIYQKISKYYISKNNIIEAIDYLLLSEDYEEADYLLKESRYKYISTPYYVNIYHWEKKIPQKIALKYGSFSLIKAIIALGNLDEEKGDLFINNAEKLFNSEKDKEGILKKDIIYLKVLQIRHELKEAYILANNIYNEIIEESLETKIDILTEKLYIATYLGKVDEEFNVLKNETTYIDENNIMPYEIQVLSLLEFAAYLIGEYKMAMDIQIKYRNMISPLNSIVYTIRIYMVWGNLEEGRGHIHKEINNAKHFALNNRLPELYGILAEIEFHMGEYNNAEKYFKRTMDLFENKNNNLYHLCVFTYINMLAFLGRKKDVLEMIDYYYPLIDKKNYWGLMMADMMLCQTYLIIKDYDLAIEYANKSMIPSIAYGTKLYIATLNAVLAAAYLAKGCIDETYKYAKTTMKLSENGYYIQDFITYYEYYRPLYEFCLEKGIQKDFVKEITDIGVNKVPANIEQNIKKIYVIFFGDNIVQVNGKLVRWRTLKAHNIFYYIFYNNKTGITKEKLIDIFFENYDLDKANNNLRTSLSYIRKAFQDVGIKDILFLINGRYFINDKNIISDLDSFNKIIKKYKQNEEDLNILSKELCEIYKGHFCEDIDIYELNLDKERYFNIFQESIFSTIDFLENKEIYKEAINLINILMQHQKYDKRFYRKKIELYYKAGDIFMMKKTEEELLVINESLK